MTEAIDGRRDVPRSSYDRLLAAVVASGLRHQVRGDHVQVECPTHTDGHPSLSVDYRAQTGSVVLHCQSGCDPHDVLAALELTWPMLHDDYEDPHTFAARRAQDRSSTRRPSRRARGQAKPERPALPKGRLPARLTQTAPRPAGDWVVTATYDYPDPAGVVVHQEVRHERPVDLVDVQSGEITRKTEKRFTQRWAAPGGGWLDKAPAGFVPVLYRLPELLGWVAAGRRIWLCEGAKDAERILELGECATTNPAGAGNFKPEQAASLVGAHVVVVLDHDLAGYRRGLRLAGLLVEAASLRLVLPLTAGRHQDLSDHLDARHSLADLVDVTPAELRHLEQLAEAEEAALLAGVAAQEAAARAQRAQEAPSPARRDDEARYAARWAAEAGKQLGRAAAAVDTAAQLIPPADPALQARLFAALAACQQAVSSSHSAAGTEVPEHLQEYLQAPSRPPTAPADTSRGQTTAAVLEHPTLARLPEPHGPVPMSRGRWAYELGGEGRRARGVYQLEDGHWVRVAPLPHLHARIVSRDGYGRPMGTYYLVSATADSARITIGQDELAKHTWPNILGLAISHDDRILRAATTALIFAAEEETEVVEATPRATSDGRISLPVPETLPHGYLATSPIERERALATWAQLVELAAESPRLALVLGAAAFGPFLAVLGNRQPHIVSLYGDVAQGKSVTMRAAAAIWGNPGSKAEAGVCESWNQSKLAPTSYLGELGLLPAFFDEVGMAGNLTAADWGKRIFDICEGASRGRPAANGRPGFVRGRSWYGILISAGNSRLMDGIGAGGMAGTQRRVVELSTPFTHSREHADAIEALYPQAYGHLGVEILARHSAATVQPFLDRAAELLGAPDGDSPVMAEIVKHLVSHIAGAALIDDLVGTRGLLTAAALRAAWEYLSEWQEPLHDADRMLDAIHDSLFSEPACWPTLAQHLENAQPPAGYGPDRETWIARHGVAPRTKGLVANDEEWLAVFPSVWEELCKALGVDSDVACRELTQRGVLIRQGSSRKPGARNHTSVVRVGTATKRLYKLVYPALDDPEEISERPSDQRPPTRPETPAIPSAAEVAAHFSGATAPFVGPEGTDSAPNGADSGPVTATGPDVTAGVTAANVPLTSPVTAVTAVTAPPSRVGARTRKNPEPQVVPVDPVGPLPACLACGEPASQLVDGHPLHLAECLDHLDKIRAAGPPPSPAPPPANRAAGLQRQARFSAPAAVLDATGLHLADGSVCPWPAIGHLGDLAALTGRDQLRLGWGGGEDRLPDQGQIWLTAAALQRLGLPTSPPALPDRALTKAQRARESAKGFAKLDDHPLLAGAREAGWQLGQGGHLDVWTRIWHPELLPGGAFLVGLPWHRIEGVRLWEDDPEPGELARRLWLFASAVGVSWRITSAATGLDLIDHHRPPRRSADDDRGQGRRRVALVRGVAAELPGWRTRADDPRFAGLEQDWSWWRAWSTLDPAEQGLRYVHGYDRNASYLAPWRGLELGVEDLVHRTGPQAAWDGRERPGYYLVDAWDWPYWGLPDPGLAAGARVGKGRVWVTVHTLKQLAAHGITPAVHESYTWAVTARYLEGPGGALATARTQLGDAAGADPGAAAALATVKALYSATVGKLAEREHHGDYHLWRPDWRDHVIGATRTAILHTVTKAQEISGRSPLVVDRDAVFYASDDPDPATAWPGDPTKLGAAVGAWKPIGSAELTIWGPQFLPKRIGRWHYSDAVQALTDQIPGDA